MFKVFEKTVAKENILEIEWFTLANDKSLVNFC